MGYAQAVIIHPNIEIIQRYQNTALRAIVAAYQYDRNDIKL